MPVYEEYEIKYGIPIIFNYASLASYSFCFLVYMAIVVEIFRKRRLQQNHVFFNKEELSILSQAIIICGVKSSISLLWIFSYMMPQTKIFYALMYSLSMVDTGYDPYLYLVFNKTLRNHILGLLTRRRVQPLFHTVDTAPKRLSTNQHNIVAN
uniref:7TM GPCR serpentine receptor class x (Srx) domain-containing protein n=1 Tax=Acrobeloides nanus TaxID=290746 RepID=A0A914DZR1_9BILA